MKAQIQQISDIPASLLWQIIYVVTLQLTHHRTALLLHVQLLLAHVHFASKELIS